MCTLPEWFRLPARSASREAAHHVRPASLGGLIKNLDRHLAVDRGLVALIDHRLAADSGIIGQPSHNPEVRVADVRDFIADGFGRLLQPAVGGRRAALWGLPGQFRGHAGTGCAELLPLPAFNFLAARRALLEVAVNPRPLGHGDGLFEQDFEIGFL